MKVEDGKKRRKSVGPYTDGLGVFEALRENVDLTELAGRQTELKCCGRTHRGHCPFSDHPDRTPSFHVYPDGRFYCFGCGRDGDVVDLWATVRGIEPGIEAALDLAREYSVQLPEQDPEAKRRAERRRAKEDLYMKQAQKYHKALSRHENIADWWQARGFGESLRERFLLGASEGGTEAIIPFWHRGRVEGVIRRKLEGQPKYRYPNKESFAAGYRPVFIPGAIKDEVFIVEGILDALALVAVGKSAIAVGGTNLSGAQALDLDRIIDRQKVYILPDADEAGQKAAATWARQLYPKALLCKPDYGADDNKDFGDLFANASSSKEIIEHLSRLVAGSIDLVEAETEVAKSVNGWRQQLSYIMEHVIPLVARVEPESLRLAMLDILHSGLEGIKKVKWLTKALQEECQRIAQEGGELLIQAAAEAKEEAERQYRQKVANAQAEIDELFKPGVLERFRKDAAEAHNVKRDKEALKLAVLVACGAQLAPLKSGRPLGASILLTGEAGRGKNHNVDAAVKLLPPEFYFAFEIASGQSLYYKADEDPDFLKHTFAYPNEIEGAEALWEFLRPMLSKGEATKIVTAKDADGNMTTRTIIVEGPVTIAIPTIRNKTDEQLQTRLLVAELPDYPGRVKEHSRALSEQLHPDFAEADFSYKKFLWQEGFRQLAQRRKVIFPLEHPDFALDDDTISHGARMWGNLLGLMATHAWLEQNNRDTVRLESGEEAIVATPEDYRVANEIFNKVCKRSVINLSDTHRRILGALYDLEEENPTRSGFTTREIASLAKCSPQTVSNNKTFLVTSAKMIKESEDGLALVHGAEPSWWAEGDLTKGLPTPEKVESWWKESSSWPKNAGHGGRSSETGQNLDTYLENSVHPKIGQTLDVSSLKNHAGHVQSLSSSSLDGESGIDKPNGRSGKGLSSVSTDSGFQKGLDAPSLGDDAGVEI